MLEITELSARFGPILAVREASLSVASGELHAIVGPNGAGKTTLLRAVIGQHGDRDGSVRVDGKLVRPSSPTSAARAGVAIVPQGRRLFPSLTVREHLEISMARAARGPHTFGRDKLFEFFPGLARRLDVRAAMLSGGEQQMLAIGRATLLCPRVVLMDEPTEGLAPAIVANVAALISHLPTIGMGVLVTEQSHTAWITGAHISMMRRGEVQVSVPMTGGRS